MRLARAWPVLAAALLLATSLALPARAELVVFVHQSYLHVDGFAVEGDTIRLLLPGGAKVVMPLEKVERIVEDVVATAPEPEPPAVFSLRFDAAQPRPEVPWGEVIYAAAERHALNPALVAAVVRSESAFDAGAVSSKGARGLMQLMPATALRFGLAEHEIFDPARNVDAGSRYLAWLIGRFGERLDWVLAAYNAGEGTVDRYGGVPPYRETRDYLRRIYSALGLPEAGAVAAVVP